MNKKLILLLFSITINKFVLISQAGASSFTPISLIDTKHFFTAFFQWDGTVDDPNFQGFDGISRGDFPQICPDNGGSCWDFDVSFSDNQVNGYRLLASGKHIVRADPQDNNAMGEDFGRDFNDIVLLPNSPPDFSKFPNTNNFTAIPSTVASNGCVEHLPHEDCYNLSYFFPANADAITFKFTGIHIGDIPDNHQKKVDNQQNHQGNAKVQNRATVTFDLPTNKLSFENAIIDTVFLNNNISTIDDPILNGEMIVGDTILIGSDPSNQGWFFSDTTYEIIADNATVLTADLVDMFLFDEEIIISPEIHGLEEDLIFDSELQAFMDNIVINNVINSPYLNQLQENIDNGKQRGIAIFSDIVLETNGFTSTGSSESIIWDDAIKTPEPSSSLSFFAIGLAGITLSLKHKLKSSQVEKD